MTTYSTRSTLLLLAAVALPLAGGCGKSKTAQCNSLVEVINTNVKEYNDAPEPKNDAELKKLAAIFKKNATAMSAVQVEDEKLKEIAQTFSKTANETAAGIDAIADIQGDASPEDMKKARDNMSKGMDGLKKNTDALNEYCK